MKPFFLLTLLSCFLFVSSPSYAKSKQQLIGKVLGKKIYLEDVENKTINDLRKQLYQAELKQFKLNSLELLGKKKRAYRIPLKFKISDSDLRAFYDQNRLSEKGSFENFKPQIHNYLQGQMLVKKMDQLYAKAVRKKLIQPLIVEPTSILVQVPIHTAFTWGKANKKQAMILEFSDYHCPYCSRFKKTMDQVRAKYKGKALFGYRHYPLPFHERADEAAIAAECAREQGKFPAMHDLIYKNPSSTTNSDYLNMARDAGVPKLKKFATCLKNDSYRNLVEKDKQEANKVGISGTPSMIIGVYDPKSKSIRGEVLSGALSFEETEKTLKKYMR